MSDATFLLASTSPTRISILRRAGLAFEHTAPHVDESLLKLSLREVPAEQWAESLAGEKAQSVSHKHPNRMILGADQTLLVNNLVLDKPTSIAEAKEQLLYLRGRTHRLKSAAALVRNGTTLWTGADEATLQVRDFSAEFLDTYLNEMGSEVLSSVGCYKLEDGGAQLFSAVTGDYFTILGLPMWQLMEELRQKGFAKT